jgi:glycosyltransferase involved in cell wall biosynthesis
MKIKLLFLVTEDWYFWSHRLPIARAARDAGMEVYVMTRVNQHADAIREEGFRLIPWKGIVPGGVNPFRELRALAEVVKQYRSIRPDLVHHVHNKPILYGGLAARWCRIPALNTVAGLGHVFADKSLRMRALQRVLLVLFRFALKGSDRSLVAFQNSDDFEYFLDKQIILPNKSLLIRGSGVDLDKFSATPIPSSTPIVMLAARLHWKKGVREFVSAAEAIKRQKIDARFVLVGDPDPNNPTSVPESMLEKWHNDGVIEWWGRRTEMAKVLSQATIICLPSTYREGVPKVLIEAASCCRPIVTTDIAGCRDIVQDGENGILVPPGDTEALVKALCELLGDRRLQEQMGKRGRQIVAERFSEKYVISETSAAYQQLVPHCPALISNALSQVT